MLAWIRPHAFDFPLLVHVLGAMVLVGAVAAGVTAELVSVGSEAPERLRRLAFRTLLFVALPAFIVMRVGAEWIRSKEFPSGVPEPSWLGIGYITADGGGLFLLVALIVAGLASRKANARLGRVAGILAAVALVFWLVAVWAMAGKPD